MAGLIDLTGKVLAIDHVGRISHGHRQNVPPDLHKGEGNVEETSAHFPNLAALSGWIAIEGTQVIDEFLARGYLMGIAIV